MDSAFLEPTVHLPASAGDATPCPDGATVPRSGFRSSDPPEPQSHYGPYERLNQLGRGGMGTVYRARHVYLGREVALKLLRNGPLADEDARKRFLTEGSVVAGFDHPNIVRVYDFGDTGSEPYCAMELVGGGSLALRLARGPLAPREAAAVVEAVAGAMQYAHDRGVVHRDLKPANILLPGVESQKSGVGKPPTPDSGLPTPKVADFGLARTSSDAGGEATAFGTASYMAPEQAQPGSPVGPAADVYGLGAVLYECLTGEPPFHGPGDYFATLRLVVEAEPVPPSRLRAGVPPELDELCMQCLAKDPAARPGSAAAMAGRLRRYRDATAPGPAPRARRFVRRHAVSLLLTGLAFVALGGAFAPGTDLGARRAESQLAAGEKVVLVPPKGPPAWYAVRYAPEQAQVSRDPHRPFEVGSWDYTFVELIRDPQHARYRLTAELRQLTGDEAGQVGVYVAGRSVTQGALVAQSALAIFFDDLYPDRPGPRPNPLHQDARLQTTLNGEHYSWTGYTAFFPTRIQPAGFGPKGWRTLCVEVTPEGVVSTVDGVGDPRGRKLGLGELEDYFADPNNLQQHIRDKLPPTERFPARGGLGLFVEHASAAFRNVTVEPLPAP